MKKIDVQVKRLAHAADLPLPAYQSELAAGLDLVAAIPHDSPMVLAPGEHTMVPTGLCMALPPGTEGQVRPRSGLASRHGVTVLNAPGTVDADFRGEIQVILINHGSDVFTIERGMRIAQLVIATTMQANICESAILSRRGFSHAATASQRRLGYRGGHRHSAQRAGTACRCQIACTPSSLAAASS